MSVRPSLIALGACLALCAITALALGWSFEKALILSPVIVWSPAPPAFLIVLWSASRVGVDQRPSARRVTVS